MEPYDVAMVKEGTPGKYQLRAVLPGSRRPLIESYASLDGVAARRAALEQAGYNVLVTFMEGELLQLEGHRRDRGADRLGLVEVAFEDDRVRLIGESEHGPPAAFVGSVLGVSQRDRDDGRDLVEVK